VFDVSSDASESYTMGSQLCIDVEDDENDRIDCTSVPSRVQVDTLMMSGIK
jgi:hypothetical protein